MISVIVIAGTIWFVSSVTFLHFARPEIDPRTRGVSRYAAGKQGWIVRLAFTAIAIACAAAVASLRGFPAAAFATAAGGMLFVILFPLTSPVPRRIEYATHQAGGAIFFCAATAGAFVVAPVVGICAAVALGLFVTGLAWPSSLPGRFTGYFQRACFLLIALSLLIFACRS